MTAARASKCPGMAKGMFIIPPKHAFLCWYFMDTSSSVPLLKLWKVCPGCVPFLGVNEVCHPVSGADETHHQIRWNRTKSSVAEPDYLRYSKLHSPTVIGARDESQRTQADECDECARALGFQEHYAGYEHREACVKCRQWGCAWRAATLPESFARHTHPRLAVSFCQPEIGCISYLLQRALWTRPGVAREPHPPRSA